MIVDGNYVFLDFEKIKPMLVDVFCKYYGKEYKQEIETKLNRVNYYGYHDYKDVVDYYNEYIEKFRDEIIYEFFKIQNIPYSDSISEEIFPSDRYLVENLINLSLEGGELIGSEYSTKAKETILSSRQRLAEILRLGKSDIFDDLRIQKKWLNKAIEIVERKHECDVFKDARCIANTKSKVFKKYFKELTDIGVPISIKDRIIVNDEYCFDDSSVNFLESCGIFFDDEFLGESAVKSFTEDFETKETFQDKYKFLFNRLRFLDFSGVEFQYIEDLEDLPETYEGLHLLEKEYEYQKNNFEELETIAIYDIKEWKKEWKKGNFIPKEIAESIEYIRNECQDELFIKCKNFDFYKKNKFQLGNDNFVTYNFDKKDNMKPYYNVFINEGLLDNRYALCALLHELNHVMGFYPSQMGSYMLECKEGLSMLSFEYLSKLEEEGERWDWFDDEFLEILQENVNERLTREIAEIFLKYYPNPFAESKFKSSEKCEYDYYDFITEEFYKANSKLLKKNVMQKSPTNLYYDSDGYYEKKGFFGSLRRLIGNLKYKMQDEERTKFSVSDLRRIGELMAYFQKEVLYFVSVKDITEEQIESGEYKKILDKEESERLEYVIKERDRLNKLLVEGRKKSEKRTSIFEK